MNIKINRFLGIFSLLIIFLSLSSTSAFATSMPEKCISTHLFTICIPTIPPRPTLPPRPTMTPKPSPTFTPTPTMRPTPIPIPVVIGAALKNYKKPIGRECNINVPSQYSTIQAGIDAAVNGNTICVKEGTYNENVIINKSIRLSGNGANKTTINGQITNDVPGYYTVFIVANNVTLEGFLINGVGNNYGDATLYFNDPLSGAIVRFNQIVAGSGELPFRAQQTQANELLQNNVLVGNNSPELALVSSSASNVTLNKVDFLNNTFTGTATPSNQDGATILSDAAANSIIKGNIFNTTGTFSLTVFAPPSSMVNENNFNVDPTGLIFGKDNIKVWNAYSGTLNAENNWWGDLDPSDNVQGTVDFTPFATSPFAEN